MVNYSAFLNDFFNDMVDIFRVGYPSAQHAIDYYPLLDNMRNQLMETHQLDIRALENEDLERYLPHNVKQTLTELNIAPSTFIDVVFLKKATLEKEPLADYIQNLHNSDNWTASLYHFQQFLQDNELDVSDFKNQLKSCFGSLKQGQNFELLSNVAVFIEAYNQTREGQYFFKNEFDSSNPNESFKELFRRMNNASVFANIHVKEDSNNHLQCQFISGGGGDFDGLYIFPDDKGGLFVRQAQINATSDMGTKIEKSSFFRHAISNIMVAKALDNAFTHRYETKHDIDDNGYYYELPSLIDVFKVTPGEFKDSRVDLLQEQKQNALLTIMSEEYNSSFNNAQTFSDVVRDLNKNTQDYIYKCFGEKPPLARYAAEDMMKSLNFVDVSNYFISKTAHKDNPDYDRSTLGQVLDSELDLNMKEFRHGLQVVGLSTFVGKLIDQTRGLEVAFNITKSRCVDAQGDVDPTRLNKLGQQAFERLIFDHFILPDADTIQTNYNALGLNSVREALNDYIAHHVIIPQDSGEKLNEKMDWLDINTTQDLESICQKMLNIDWIDENHDRHNQFVERLEKIEDKKTIIEKDQTINQEQEINLINRGLTIKTYEPDKYEQFIQNNELNQETQQMIEQLHNDSYNGSTQSVDSITLEDYKHFDFPDINSFQTSANTPSQRQSIDNKKEQRNGTEHKPK